MASTDPIIECDLVVFGTGAGGLATSLAAADAGFRVVICEKDNLIGGGSALAHGGLWAACNHVAQAKGLTDTREAGLDYMRSVAGHAADEELMLAYVDSASPASNSGLSAQVASCIATVARRAKFDPPGAAGSTIQVPFNFLKQGGS